jgi:hypothetical protein
MLKIVFKIAKGDISKDTAKVKGLEGSQATKGLMLPMLTNRGG